jgi:hypothetical protein
MTNDVTAGYIIFDAERLRKPMQLITDALLKSMTLNESFSKHDETAVLYHVSE